jgi:hypothetical protein
MRKLLTSTLACALLWAAPGWAQEFIRQYPATATGVSLKAISATAVQVTGATEEVVRTYPIPAGLFEKSGDALRVKLSITAAANANAKTIKVRLGGVAGTQIFASLSGGNGAVWDIELTVFRTSAANAQLTVSRYNGNLAGTSIPATTTSAVDLAAASSIDLTFTCPTATTDLTSNSWTVELLKL